MQTRSRTLLIATLVTAVVSWCVSWVLVFHFGYRHSAWFGIGLASYDASQSFAFLALMIGAGIACFVTPFLVFCGATQSD